MLPLPLLRRIITSPKFYTSLIYFLGQTSLSFGRYLFHILLMRLFVPAQYGEFLSYLSLTYLISIPTGALSLVTVTKVATWYGAGALDNIRSFIPYLTRRFFWLFLIVGLTFALFSQPLATVFKAEPGAFVVLGISLIITFYSSLIRSFLAGLQMFLFQTFVSFLEIIMIIGFAYFFVTAGYGATGAIIGQFLAAIVVTILALIRLKSYLLPIKLPVGFHVPLKQVLGFGLVNSMASMAFLSIDVLAIRAFMSPEQSGIYASLSMLGRMIFFGLNPIAGLAVPFLARRHGARLGTTFFFLIFLTSMISLGTLVSFIFSIFPAQIIGILAGGSYLAGAGYLGYLAFSMSLLALNLFLAAYHFAVGHGQSNYIVFAMSLLQPVLIYIFRHDLYSVIIAGLAIQSILFVTLITYTIRYIHTRDK
jgi:O-antigen/teichoic acid export membrane protein